jgi:hypothetical protein
MKRWSWRGGHTCTHNFWSNCIARKTFTLMGEEEGGRKRARRALEEEGKLLDNRVIVQSCNRASASQLGHSPQLLRPKQWYRLHSEMPRP